MGYYVERNSARSRARAMMGLACALPLSLAACSSLGSSGPSTKTINSAPKKPLANADIHVIDVTDAVGRRVITATRPQLFSTAFGDALPRGTIIGRGDILSINIWEAPPPALFGISNTTFGQTGTSTVLADSASTGLKTTLPDTMVDDRGEIKVPFAGAIEAAGRTPREVEREITARLAGKAHDPQVSVQISSNASADITIVGEVATNARVPLTPRGERLLDVIASAGGVKEPIGKVTIQISRGGRTAYMGLDAVIRDPAQNIRLAANDVITALYQPFSFTALGSIGTSAEVPFESTGLTLAQALGRVGGLKDDRADLRGAFIFRLEDPRALDPAIAATARRTPDGRIPVIYRVDLHNPATFFVAQSFPIRDKDVLYVSAAPLSDFQRFFSMVSSMTFSLIGLSNAVP